MKDDALAIAMAGIAAADAGLLTERAIADNIPLTGGATVLAAGKAAHAMAVAAERALGTRVNSSLVVTPEVAGHPLPTAESERAGRRALELAAPLPPADTLLVLLSGGASSLLAVPADGITLDDKRRTAEQLLLAGADIHSLNVVRKHISAIKGGWLAATARCRCHTLVISDVAGDDVSVIASGPTVADATTFDDALEVLRTHRGFDAYPPAVVTRLRAGARGELAETPKPGDARLERSEAVVIGGRLDAMDGAAREAESRGYRVIRIDPAIVGEARTAAPLYLRSALALAELVDGPVCVISSGETTVRVRGHGKGGRNQEFALAAAPLLGSLERRAVLISIGTDGVDGPTDAAGAIVDTTTLDRAHAAGLDAAQFLDANDAYPFFDALADLVRTGPTGTNVGDLQILLVG